MPTSEAGNRKSPWSLAAGGKGTELLPNRSHHPFAEEGKAAPFLGDPRLYCPHSREICQSSLLSPPLPARSYPPFSLGVLGVDALTGNQVLNPDGAGAKGCPSSSLPHPAWKALWENPPGKFTTHASGPSPKLGFPSMKGGMWLWVWELPQRHACFF